MFTRIVVAWDSSESARTALEWALRRAGATPVLVVNVVPGRETGTDYLSASSPVSNERVQLLEAAEQARATHPGVQIDTEVIRGSLVDELVRLSDPESLLVVGATPRSARRSAFGWSVGARLAGSHLPGTVAVVPQNALVDIRSGIVVGVDASAESTTVLEVAAEEAVHFGEELLLIHAWSEPPEWQDLIVPELDLVGEDTLESLHRGILDDAITHAGHNPQLTVHSSLVQRSPAAALNEAARTATELVVGNHGSRGLARFSLGSVCHTVLRDGVAPTLVVRS